MMLVSEGNSEWLAPGGPVARLLHPSPLANSEMSSRSASGTSSLGDFP